MLNMKQNVLNDIRLAQLSLTVTKRTEEVCCIRVCVKFSLQCFLETVFCLMNTEIHSETHSAFHVKSSLNISALNEN